MKHTKLIMLFCIGALFLVGKSFGQANPFINVLPSNSGIVAVGDTIDLIVTIGNSGPISTIPQAKLRPIIQVPTSVTFLPNAAQTGLPAGWTILSNSGSQLRVCNSTDPIPVSTSRTIILKAQGVTVSPAQTFAGNINFGNGTTCAAGISVAGDLITDNSATSTLQVTAFSLDMLVVSPISCYGLTNGSIQANPSVVGPTYTYTLNGGVATNTTGFFDMLGAGTYTVCATDGSNSACSEIVLTDPAQLMASSIAGSVDCNNSSTIVNVAAFGGTAPYTGTGSFTVNAGPYSYTVTDANGCTATTSGVVNSIPDMTNPSIYVQSSSLLPGVTGPSTTQSPYILSQSKGGKFTSILSVNDSVGSYRMVGIPDGLGAYDNNNGTFTLLMNHELGNTQGIVRAHGSTGAFVSKWVINKSNLAVQSGSDLIQSVYNWDTATSSFVLGTTQFNRFCSADLPSVSAFYNQATGLGTPERIFLNGEESGSEGRAFGHILTGASAGVSYQLPYLGRFSWENAVASPASGDKTVVAGTDDATPGQVYFYIGTKTNSGTDIDKAGLNNGKLWGVKVPGLPLELSASIPAANTPFALEDLGFVQNTTGATLHTNSVAAGVTNFLRPEDGAFDPSNPNDFYFVTTNSFTSPSRLWRLRFNDIANPETGGTITVLLDGTEGQKMLDNMTIDKLGHILLQEDPGGQAHSAKIWQYTIATDSLELVGKHDPARFGDLVGSTTTPATLPFNNDEESSGIIDMSDILGPGMFLLDVQAHYTTGLPNLTEVVQGGQLLAFFNPASVSATASTANDTVFVSTNNCAGVTVSLGTPATSDNCSVASVTNDAPSTFLMGNTTVTWTVTDANGNTNTATQIVVVQPAQPSLACYETATFNYTTCSWDITGSMPPAPTGLACYETATFDTISCSWVVTGTMPAMPNLACYETATFNTTSCSWVVTGSPNPPIVTTISACVTYNWAITGLNYTASGVYTANVACQDYTLNLTINPLPTVTASDVSACAGNSVSLIGNPSGGTFSVANPYSGPTTTYTYTYTDGNGCTNTSAPANIFTTAAPPVTGINMSNIGGNSATVNWNGIPGLIWYEIRYRAVGAGSWTGGGTQAAPTTFKNIVGLTAGTQYEVEVRGFCSTPNYPGPWSATSIFTTSNSCVAPMNLNAINITGTTTTLTWTAIPNTNYYQIRYRLAAGPGAWVNGTASGTATSKNYTGLALNTNYEWQIRAICNPSPFTTGPWSEISDWTTLASKPSVTEEVSLQEEIMVYPNPATSVVMVDITATNAQQTVVKLFDISGRLVKQMQARHEAGSHTMIIGLDEISSGMYTVQVYCNDALKHTSKISKQD
ncbi:MAG: fibronectin type III domain-containing protein [Flavobacterium sp.]|uniref:fibronectin type III domain-containing protein n=1 Tax=Flavobacterium sp. TaxID=239 RepID=UPI003BE28F8F